jgi:hypothetical protein
MQKKSSNLQENQKQRRTDWRLSSVGEVSENRKLLEVLINNHLKSKNFKIGMVFMLKAKRYFLKKRNTLILSYFNNGKAVVK